MNAKVVVLGVLAATVLLVVLMVVSPDQRPAPAQQTTMPDPSQPVPAPTHDETQAAATGPAVGVPASPLPSEEERAAIEERIEARVERMPALARLRLWWFLPGQQMSDEDYENARGLYLRFLDNFARIETAQFRVEWTNILKDGSQELSLVDTVVWSPPRFLTEQMRHEPGKEAVRTRTVWVCDGKKVSRWQNGRKTYTGRANNWGLPANYVFAMEMAAIREAHPFFLNRYTHCDIDDGTRGYSRLWNENGAEARFNTATGLLTEYHFGDGGGWAHTYQEVGGLWFPLEAVNTFTEVDIRNSDLGHQGVRGFRQVFSRVVLNEPLDESLFDLNNPG